MRSRLVDLVSGHDPGLGDACLAPTQDGWIDVDVRSAGTVRLDISVAKTIGISGDDDCTA